MNPNLLRVCQRSFGEGYATSAATYAPTVSCCWRDHRQRCDARVIPRAGSCRSNRPRRFVHLASWIFRARTRRTQDAHAHLQRESSGAADGHAAGTHLTRHAREHTAARFLPSRREGIDGENNPNHFNTTNLHVHGLQVIPHLFAPVGTSDPASRMIAIGSGQSLTYDFQLPDDHPAGLYWYHPHHHGSATVQVGGGMAGLILVKGAIDEVPEIAAAHDELLAIQNIKINPLVGGQGLWGWEPIAYRPADQGGYYFTTQMELSRRTDALRLRSIVAGRS